MAEKRVASESLADGAIIAHEFFDEHLRAPTMKEYAKLAKGAGGAAIITIRRHFGTYNKWLRSIGLEVATTRTGRARGSTGTEAWQRLNTMPESEFQAMVADMFQEFAMSRINNEDGRRGAYAK